ncbi:hypothetical protein HKX48_001153 [Thoreauomyces humboldtii]|nr:hypothetical protein HKX48_001153 [Thoreauomyces humboldtii]
MGQRMEALLYSQTTEEKVLLPQWVGIKPKHTMKLSILSVATLLCASTSVSAAPTTTVSTSTTDAVHVPLTRTVGRVAPAQRVAARHVERIAKAKGVPLGDVPYGGSRDQFWNIPVTVGKNQNFQLCLDSGSWDIWIRGANCVSPDTSCGPTRPHVNVSDPHQFKNTTLSYKVGYASGYSNGSIVQGDYTIGSMTAKNAYFGVSRFEADFDEIIDSGMIGLGFPSRSNIATQTNGKGPAAALGVTSFGMYLQNSEDGDSGVLTFNGVDETKFHGDLSYHPVHNVTQGYWSLSTLSSTVSLGKVLPATPITVDYSIVDSGTAGILLGTTEANAIISHFNVTSDGYIDCDVARTGPDLTIRLQGRPFVIPASMYVVRGTVESPQCSLGIYGGADNVYGGVLGGPFLRAYYAYHDYKNLRMGFAKAIHPKARA